MGRFKIDDILRQLSDPNPNAPAEKVPGAGEGPTAAHVPQGIAAPKPLAATAAAAPAGGDTSSGRFRWETGAEAAADDGAANPEASNSASAATPESTPVPQGRAFGGRAVAEPVASADDGLTDLPGYSAPPAPSTPQQAAAPVTSSVATGYLAPSRSSVPSGGAPGQPPSGESSNDIFTPDGEGNAIAGDLESLLAQRGIASAEQILSAQRIRKQAPGRRMPELLKEQGVDEHRVQEAVAELARMPFVRIDAKSPNAFDRELMSKLGGEFCRTNLVLPIGREGSRVVIATANPDDVFLIDDVKRRLGVGAARHVLAAAGDIAAALQSVVEANARSESDEVDVESMLAGVDGEEDIEVEKDDVVERDIEAEAESSPIVRYVNHIIQTALKEGASDIHIEPDEKTLKVRFRIDGILFESMSPPKKMHAAITSRLKIMANLDIAERRLPQDGRIRCAVLGRKLDLRVSTVPTPKGEKTVMRILDSRSISVSLDDLGFAQDTLTIWKNQIDQPHGIILVTGPTGSGKTTTLYSSIRQMDTRRMNVSTVEDPIEYNLAGITQIQTHEKIGMTFAKALKALLRQDPDVIMVGEVRDQETALTAIQAALTGHLVLSTLHTNDAPSSVTRMINIGIEPFLVAAALNGVLAQRLVRKICPHCSEERPIPEDMRDFVLTHGIDRPTLKQGVGCASCRQTGYAGRLGLYELLVLDDFLRDKVAANPNVVEFRRLCIERGMTSLRDDGFAKVREGRTTVEEVLRVTEATI
ncbi:MAG: ATPase, T2SS/T4P/T4SS family [Planctomycetota bacterium]